MPKKRPDLKRVAQRFKAGIVPTLLVGVALALVLGVVGSRAGLGTVGSVAAQPNGANLLADETPVPYSQRWRIGFGLDRNAIGISNYDTSLLCAGWYHDWGIKANPPRPQGMEFVQTVRVGEQHFDLDNQSAYSWATLDQAIDANPGSLWLIGNEPDGNPLMPACDGRYPAEYAEIYSIFYDYIKGRDPTALVGNGGIIQGSPIRLNWLGQVWDAYLAQHPGATEMPVDVWNMHNQIIWERRSGGADLPLGCTNPEQAWSWLDTSMIDDPRYFRDAVENMRQFMKDHGQQDKPLIISEYGMMQTEDHGFTVDRVNEYMTNTFLYLFDATSTSLGMPGDGYRMVQRWNWFALNVPYGSSGYGHGVWNGTLFDPDNQEITEFGRHFAELACISGHPSPTPEGTPLPGTIYREAEDGSVKGALRRQAAGSASDCRYVCIPTDTDGGGVNSEAVFMVKVPSGGNYTIWGRGKGVDWNNWKFNVSVRGSNVGTFDFYGFGYWDWDVINSVPMNGGWNEIRVGPGGVGHQQFDVLVVTSNQGYDPWLDPSLPKVCNPTATLTPTQSPTPTITATPTVTRTPMPTGPAGLAGSVSFQGRGDPGSPEWADTIEVTAHMVGDPIPAYKFVTATDTQGHFSVGTGIYTGTYDVAVRNMSSLPNMRPGVVFTETSSHDIDFGTLIEGDANGDSQVGLSDLVILASAYDASAGDPGYSSAVDFNSDGQVGLSDLVMLANNYDQSGPVTVGLTGGGTSLDSNVGLNGTVVMRCSPSHSTKDIGNEFNVVVYVDANPSNPVMGVDVTLNFNSTYLQALSVTPGGSFPLVAVQQVGGSYVRVSCAKQNTPVTSSTAVMTVRFRAKAAVGSTGLNFGTCAAEAGPGEPHTVTKQNGTVTILAPSPTPQWTRVPSPTPTNTPEADVMELFLRYGTDGYTDWWDTWIDAWNTDVNHCTDAELKIRPPNVWNILIKADVSQLPPGTQIVEAVLTLHQTQGDRTIIGKIYDVKRGWVDCQANWERATAFDDWDVDGCGGEDTDRKTLPASELPIFATSGTFDSYPFDFDITAMVQDWVNNPGENEGLLLTSTSSVAEEFKFGSAENSNEAIRPSLLIRYRQGGPLTPTPTATPEGGAGMIRGKVFSDQNGDLIPQTGEPGVAGAVVEMEKVGDPLFVERRQTDTTGEYEFAGLAPATYRVSLLVVPEGCTEIDPTPWQFTINGNTREAPFALSCEGMGFQISLPLVLRD